MIAITRLAGFEENFYLNNGSNVNSPRSRHRILAPILEAFSLLAETEKKENPHRLIMLVTGNQTLSHIMMTFIWH